MSTWAVLLTAVGVAADAFAVALGEGMSLRPCRQREALAIAATFGLFQAVMPLLGWVLGSSFAPFIAAFDHWVAFVLLAAIGLHMIVTAVRGEEHGADNSRLVLRHLLMLGVATSIDALAVGIGLALLEANVVEVVTTIGIVTFALSYLGVLIGRRAGDALGRPAGIVGGLLLIGLGTSTVLQHLGIIG